VGPVLIVLAAGLGSRFGGPGHKLSQPLGTYTVLGHTLRHAMAGGMPVVVVTTEPLLAIASAHMAARDIVVLPTASTASTARSGVLGMGYSIAAGVMARPDAAGWLVLPGDMPLVRPATLQAVARAVAVHPVAYAQHGGRRGHPVGFAAELYSELAVLSGDEGARRLVARYPAFGVDVDDPGVLIDVDTPGDLARARQLQDVSAAQPR